MKTVVWIVLVILLPLQAVADDIRAITIEGAIGPTTASYIDRSIRESEDAGAQFLILRLDTPGGLLDATQDIVRSILASQVPVVVYVSPWGASAGSAGVFITLAGHVAVMAPATNIGAAHPVQMGGREAGDPDDPYRQKIVNYAESYIETIAAERDRNVEWAKSAVRESASITAERALELNVIDLIAETDQDLLLLLDGYEVNGTFFSTADGVITEIPMTQAERIFHMLFRPEVIFILMLVAIYGLIGELTNPGAIFPGVVGAVALILVLYTMAVIPVNLAGVALIVLAIGLFITEMFTPTYGILTVGGAVTFLAGSLMLFDDLSPVFDLSLAFVIPATILTILFFAFVAGKGIQAQFGAIRTGREAMIGQIVEAYTPVDQNGGKVFIEGEIWNAVSTWPVEKGDRVKVTEVQGLTLTVEPMQEN